MSGSQPDAVRERQGSIVWSWHVSTNPLMQAPAPSQIAPCKQGLLQSAPKAEFVVTQVWVESQLASRHVPRSGHGPAQVPPQLSASPHDLPAQSGVQVTVTEKSQVAVWPLPSVAVHVTGVVPMANEEPDGGSQEMPTPAQLSVAVAE
jgi:hypothetical protein